MGLLGITVAVSRLKDIDFRWHDTLGAFSLAFTICTTLVKIFEAKEFLEMAAESQELNASLRESDALQDCRAAIYRNVRWIKFGWFLLILSLGYAAAKFIMIYLCRDAVWNAT